MYRGFTLVELVIVAVIISILFAIGIPSFRVALEKARLTEAHNILGAMRKTHLVCISINGSTCVSLGELGRRGFENTTLKYFDDPRVQNTTNITSPSNSAIIAKIKRRSESAFGNYTVCMNFMGNITCNGTGCSDLGMESASYCESY